MTMRLRATASTVRLRAGAMLLGLGPGRECTLCGWTGVRFLAAGPRPNRQPDARCPRCRSLARHRLAHGLLRDRLASGQRTLHVAPEPPIEHWLRGLSSSYLSIDTAPGRAMRAMSLTGLDLDDGAFTLIFCSHVLEHIPDDRAAMAELRRVLDTDGLAVILVPTRAGPTDEDSSLTTDAERRARFGQADHVRVYGSDLSDRLEGVGFKVEVLTADDLDPDLVERGALGRPDQRRLFLAF